MEKSIMTGEKMIYTLKKENLKNITKHQLEAFL